MSRRVQLILECQTVVWHERRVFCGARILVAVRQARENSSRVPSYGLALHEWRGFSLIEKKLHTA